MGLQLHIEFQHNQHSRYRRQSMCHASQTARATRRNKLWPQLALQYRKDGAT